jgi:hypothetical protein
VAAASLRDLAAGFVFDVMGKAAAEVLRATGLCCAQRDPVARNRRRVEHEWDPVARNTRHVEHEWDPVARNTRHVVRK